jgi:hypothetical protein
VTGAAALAATQPSVLAERRIGPVPVTPGAFNPSSIGWLQTREMELSIELRVIRGMIAQFGPRRSATAIGAPKKAKSKKAKRAKAAIKQAA